MAVSLLMEETRVPKENHRPVASRYIRHAIEILTFFTVGIKGMGTGPSFSIMGNNSSIEWDVIECLLYGECHAPLLPFVTCQIMKTYHCFKTNTSLVFLKRKQTNLNINFHTDIMLHSKSAVLSDSKKHSPKVSVSKPRYS
jgi:hypothetical protein